MAISAIEIVSVPVSDQKRAKSFYTEVLGFTVLSDAEMGDERWVMLAPPGGGPAITLVTWFPTMPPGSMKGLVLACEDIDETYARLADGGVMITDGIQDAPWARWFALDDPDGNGIVVQRRKE